jgi:hypothetical protein
MVRERPRDEWRNGLLEAVCVLVVMVAVALLLAWFVVHAGGGVINQG